MYLRSSRGHYQSDQIRSESLFYQSQSLQQLNVAWSEMCKTKLNELSTDLINVNTVNMPIYKIATYGWPYTYMKLFDSSLHSSLAICITHTISMTTVLLIMFFSLGPCTGMRVRLLYLSLLVLSILPVSIPLSPSSILI